MRIHIVSHTHWDREWYRPFQYFKVRLSYFFDKLLPMMESDKEYKHFMLDGQMVMLEDYLNLKPKYKTRIEKLIKDGRLIIGPWYTQPDEFAPDGESLIRNLLIGTSMAREYGECMMVGYLPDSFGQSCQMPHILSGSSIDAACMMRGVPLHKVNKSEFVWRGLNGDEVLAVSLPKGYSNAMFLPKENTAADMRVKKVVGELMEIGNDENFLLMDGVDHQFPNENITKYINSKSDSKNEYIHSSLEKYIEDAGKDFEKLNAVEGELISPVSNRVHTSIASTRMYQKKMNRQVQNLLVNGVEPLCSISWVLGCDYPKEIINDAWKEVLKNQAHDGICGCCTDEVHREMDQRFTDIKNMGITLKKMHSRAIARGASPDELSLVVFNDAMTSGKYIVNARVYIESDEFTLVDQQGNEVEYVINNSQKVDAASLSIWTLYLDTPCMVNAVDITFETEFEFDYGFKRFEIVKDKKPESQTEKLKVESNKVENKYYIVDVNNDGTFNLLDKQLDKKYFNLNTIEDCGDAGDTYNYSPVEDDTVIDNRSVKECGGVRIMQHKLMTDIYIDYELMVPKSLSKNGKARSEERVSVGISTKVTMYENIKRIDIETKINNTAKDHRVRAVFPSGIHSNYSYAETQFGTIKRSNVFEDAEQWKENKWAEKPLPIYSQQRFVDINDGKCGIAVLNRGLTEYEIYGKETCDIAVTLVRGVGYMGKADLAIRPGRPSGIHVATPEAQCMGEVVSEYSIITHEGNVDDGEIAKHAAMYCSSPTAAQNKLELTEIENKFKDMLSLFNAETLQNQADAKLNVAEEANFNFINISSDKLLISCIKKAENEDAIILRVYNPYSDISKSAEIYINAEIKRVTECNFVEQGENDIHYENNKFESGDVKAYSAKTYKIFINWN